MVGAERNNAKGGEVLPTTDQRRFVRQFLLVKRSRKNYKDRYTVTRSVNGFTNTVFPITLFPDTVTVDRTKVTITKDFFWSSDVIVFA